MEAVDLRRNVNQPSREEGFLLAFFALCRSFQPFSRPDSNRGDSNASPLVIRLHSSSSKEVGDERRRRISFSRVIRTLKLPRSNSMVIALFCSLKATGPPLCIPSLARLKACARPINRERRGIRPRIGPRNLEQLSNWDVGYFERRIRGQTDYYAPPNALIIDRF